VFGCRHARCFLGDLEGDLQQCDCTQ
jgi:hypothetical protein